MSDDGIFQELTTFATKVGVYVAFVAVLYCAVRLLQSLGPWNDTSPFHRIIRLIVHGSSQETSNAGDSGTDASIEFSSPFRRALALAGCAAGLQIFYLSWGILQERIMTREYQGEHFHSSQFLVFGNRIFALIVALIILKLTTNLPFYAPLYKLCFPSFSNVMSSFSQYEALKFVSFPTQVIFKSSKLIPVMIMGKIISKKSYPASEYGLAVLISIGVAVFTLYGVGDTDAKGDTKQTTSTGLIYLFGYICFDSFTSQFQGKIFKEYKLTPYQMMAGINFFSSFFTFMSLSISGELAYGVGFAANNPTFLMHMAMLSAAGAMGQLLIFYTIKTFGPLVFTIIMATRQLLATVLSSIIYGHQIKPLGFVGATVVFGAVALRIYLKSRKSNPSAGYRVVADDSDNDGERKSDKT